MSESYWQLHLTADKREIKDFLKLLLATSFIRKTLSEIPNPVSLKKKLTEGIIWKIEGI
jgi:hypothetical protein